MAGTGGGTLSPNPVNSLGFACGNGLRRVNPNGTTNGGLEPVPC